MIKLGKLQFGNCMPFGNNIEIALDQNTTTQLVGKNGSGKSSIPLILEELLYNKNSKGVEKGDILNRYSNATEYWMKLDFEINGVPYFIEKVVKTTAKVTLTSNGTNIGGHTTTQTYKVLAEILGMDMTTFSKLVYQSLGSSLDFLTATDGNRKKFLINLLNLEKYPAIEASIKEYRKEVFAKVTELSKEKDRINTILTSTIVPDVLELLPVPESLNDKHSEILNLTEQKSTLRNELDNLKAKFASEKDKAQKEAELNEHKLQEWLRQEALCNSIDSTILNIDTVLKPNIVAQKSHVDSLPRPQASKTLELVNNVIRLESEFNKIVWAMDETKKLYKVFSEDAAITICSACNSSLDKEHAAKESAKQKQIFVESKSKRDLLQLELTAAISARDKASKEHEVFDLAVKVLTNAETQLLQAEKVLSKKQADLAIVLKQPLEFILSAKPTSTLLSAKPTIDLLSTKPTIDLETLSKEFIEKINSIDNAIAQIRIDILEREAAIKKTQEHNLEVVKNNAKRDILEESFNKASKDIKLISEELNIVQDRLNSIDVLAKVFGPKGLIAYKLESCVKVFENKVNQYLTDVSNGKFALGFELDDAKLKVIIYSSGKQVNIKTLSSGELSKVNISTLLSIRSLMSSVSRNSLNVLFLDEVVSTIDEDGMEDLIDVLIKEHNLNTFVVSHNYQHPLVEILKVIKEENISRLEYDNWG